MKTWWTTRKVLTAVGFVTATAALFSGKMSDAVWVYSLAVLLAGHHAADLIKAMKGEK